MTVSRIVPDIQSEHLEASREFYVGLFGFTVMMDLGWIMTLASPTHPTAQLTVLHHDASSPVVPQVSIQVADVDAIHAEELRRGVPVVYPLTDEPWGVRRFFVRDPNGVVINVMCHRPSVTAS